MKDIKQIIGALKDFNLLSAKTLICKEGKVYNSESKEIEISFFSNIKVPFAVFSVGKYSHEYLKEARALRPSTDDSAMMFGGKVKVIKKGYPTTNCLILGDGFVAVGRYPKEVVAAAILVEKMAKTEVLGSALGKIHYINPLLTKIMHLVYKKRYSRREREAYVKTR